ncbi:MAG TPA: PadR family transcriptional regulator [Nocardia sp.]|uniref:PadR family transcriptional regulator n=1 Tax=Nocardia TaxID=1817 RepID=UPI00245470F0|nr:MULTISPECIES: PadR family transcriptional regulator [Nocardia]HLS76124.1 PadR family transcriptional regulator [Nocardia sp.]
MALEHALLVSLSERSGSGYELARRFDKSIGFFWTATHQQIYRVLKRMVESGWVDCESVAQAGRPDKKVYSVTAAGRAELTRWIAEPIDIEVPRSDLGVKIRGASLAGGGGVAAVCEELVRHRDFYAHRMEVLRAIEKRDFPAPDRLTGSTLHQYLVLRGGIRTCAGYIDWCEEMLAILSEGDSHR